MDKPAIIGGKPQFSEPVQFLRPPISRYADSAAEDFKAILKSNMITNFSTVEKLENEIGKYLGCGTVALNSCTSGLMLSANILGLKNQEVILPSFTFCATALAMTWNNCRLKFVDIDEETFNISPEKVEEAITPNTKAIVGVHVFGNPCKADELMQIAEDHDLKLLFDSAGGFASSYKEKKVGNFGNAESFSTGPSKIFCTIEGGILSSKDDELLKKIKLARNYGILKNYDLVYHGMSARMEEVNAAIGLRYMKDIDMYLNNRNDYAKRYLQNLKNIKGISFQRIENNSVSNYKDFAIIIDPKVFGMERDIFVEALEKENILVKKYFYPPLHKTTIYKEHSSLKLPATERVAANIVCLPLYNIMENKLIDNISQAIIKIHSHAREIPGKLG